jgi:hypothetical protein
MARLLLSKAPHVMWGWWVALLQKLSLAGAADAQMAAVGEQVQADVLIANTAVFWSRKSVGNLLVCFLHVLSLGICHLCSSLLDQLVQSLHHL